ncbi:hypothetical protein SORBI_3010G136950 [Sorghum bicolor]|uniref:Uncharacterized protein n=1 Tax=Sorghum bicolor TaxID=4558 RepID=A0A1W0VSY1_SORBI|nr:hypothetical protein SORBI_3010G136950 [Sorghum bicolor]
MTAMESLFFSECESLLRTVYSPFLILRNILLQFDYSKEYVAGATYFCPYHDQSFGQ